MNSKLKIKVCGMREPENIRQVAHLNPEYMGFILYPASKRYLGDDYELQVDIPVSIRRVGVFVNAPVNDLLAWKHKLGLHYVQLHGDEPVAYCRALYDKGISVIKAFGVGSGFDFSLIRDYREYCRFILFDTASAERGGSGRQFDWQILKEYTFDTPIFLSGGIGPEDADRICEISGIPLHAIDINSRFEDRPAFKNINTLKKFMHHIRSC